MSRRIFILNGPNLGRLGTREPEIYGRVTLPQLAERCQERGGQLGLDIEFRQTNFEGALVEHIHDAADDGQGLIINPAGLTTTSVSVMDALKMFNGPKIELHITNLYQREAVYQKSLMSKVVTAVIAGLGTDGYLHALDWMANVVREP